MPLQFALASGMTVYLRAEMDAKKKQTGLKEPKIKTSALTRQPCDGGMRSTNTDT